MLKTIFLLTLICILNGCSHPPKNSNLDQNWEAPTRSQYMRALRKNTKNHKEYKGLNQVFEADVTFLTTDFQKAQLKLKANFMNWSASEANTRMSELKNGAEKESSFLLGFFTPDPRKNKVDKDFASWTVLIVTDKGEIKGKVSLYENDADHVKIFYPTLHSWSRSYMATFPISTTELQNKKFTFKIVGPLGMGEVDFRPL